MLIDTNERAQHFGQAQDLNPILGRMFENPVEVTQDMLRMEFRMTHAMLMVSLNKHIKYLETLDALLKRENP